MRVFTGPRGRAGCRRWTRRQTGAGHGDRQALEATVLKLIADKGLDDYHRLEMHYLFLNYVSFGDAVNGHLSLPSW